ncbi:MAG: RHS repeat-associated core domain-containing protein [Chitinophagales bacterium]
MNLDYYPFGMVMPTRSFTSNDGGYRFGFNGKEMDSEVSGQGNQYDYGFRIYNPRLGKFLSVDPLSSDYPWYTPYQFAGNKPIFAIDLDGLEEKVAIIMESGDNEFSKVHESEIIKAGYVVFKVTNGGDALRSLILSQKLTDEPTRELLFLTHGLEGGLTSGVYTNAGIYSDEYLDINRQSDYGILDNSFDPDPQTLLNSEGYTQDGFAHPRIVRGNVLENYSTISDWEQAVNDGSLKFTSDAELIFGGCSIGRSNSIRNAIPNASQTDGDFSYSIKYNVLKDFYSNELADRYANLSFTEEFAKAVGVTATSGGPRLDGNVIYSGGSEPDPNDSRRRRSARWHSYDSKGNETQSAPGNSNEIIKNN